MSDEDQAEQKAEMEFTNLRTVFTECTHFIMATANELKQKGADPDVLDALQICVDAFAGTIKFPLIGAVAAALKQPHRKEIKDYVISIIKNYILVVDQFAAAMDPEVMKTAGLRDNYKQAIRTSGSTLAPAERYAKLQEIGAAKLLQITP